MGAYLGSEIANYNIKPIKKMTIKVSFICFIYLICPLTIFTCWFGAGVSCSLLLENWFEPKNKQPTCVNGNELINRCYY